MNPGNYLGIWLAVLAASGVLAAWNISRLRVVRPALDRVVALIGSAAILMLVVGASVVITEVTECTLAASCGTREILLVALIDLFAGAALVTQWLRSDACRIAMPRSRAIAGAFRSR